MEPGFLSRISGIQLAVLATVVVVILGACIAYGVNLIIWKDATDYGWRAMYDSGPNIVDEVFARGRQAGLRPGDRILFLNGRSYDTFDELFFTIRNPEPEAENVYTVLRQNSTVDIHLTNGVLGYGAVLKRSGPLFLVGLFYVFMGLVVFYMKPGTTESWVFLLMTAALGISISYASPSDLMRPLWLFNFRQFIDIFLPAPIIHLALFFPVPRKIMEDKKWFWTLPYLGVLAMIFYFRPFSSAYWDPPVHMDLVNNIYLLTAVTLFFGISIFNLVSESYGTRRDISLVRARSRVILFGILAGMLIPVVELLGRRLWGLILFPDPALFFAFFLLLFPLSIGYAIVKHNLFEVDVFIKRTVGYGLMTILVGSLYVALAASVRPAAALFPALDKVSGFYPALFALLVVFFFRPIHGRLQGAVNSHFFRESFDYKEAVISISNDLRTVLDLKKVIILIIHAVRDVMSIDSAGVIRLQPEIDKCPALFIHDPPVTKKKGTAEEEIQEDCLDLDDPLISIMERERKLITRYDLAEDPKYSAEKEKCLSRLDGFKGTMAMPLAFQDRLVGILLVGRKKSGRFYTSEDIDLLNTLTSQGAIAIENAVRAESMRDEEVVRANLARYLSPQVVEKVVSKSMDVDFDGSRKDVTVLISDIRGFTGITKTMPPEELTVVLNEYFTEMADVIFENKGSLDKYVGDALVAVFGSLIEVENHTVQAVKAAIDMVNRMARLNRKWEEEFDGFHMDIGIGVDTGEVYLGNVGSPERMEFTVIGSAVNAAQFLSDTAKPDQILLSETAAGALGGSVEVRELEAPDAEEVLGDQRVIEIVG